MVVNLKPKALSLQRLFLALSSALLLIAAFPNFNQPWCAWVGLVPWLLLLPSLSSREAFWWSHFIGFIFFIGSLWWLVYVTTFGWILLCAYLALFFGTFGWFVNRLSALNNDHRQQTTDSRPQTKKSYSLRSPVSGLRSQVSGLIAVPAAWVALEHARTHLLSGFGWNLLAYSQTNWPAVIQTARFTGAWGISFLIVAGNVGIAQAIRQKSIARLLVPGLMLLGAAIYGWASLPVSDAVPSFHVAAVQGNIPQERKWDQDYQEEILRGYESLTRKAATTAPDLIVWPETAAPGYVGADESLTQRLFSLSKEVKRPLLVGSPFPKLASGAFEFVNRANLIGEDNILAAYDKLHLVPYGEFIPGDRQFPWIRKLLPPIGDFIPGKERTVFEVPMSQVSGLKSQVSNLKFSVLICFEDVFPELARAFVRHGAQALMVITNDAWFGPTAAAYQHAQTSAFRAVELGVPVIRAANTGWSGCIDRWGRMRNSVKDANGRELFVEGFASCGIDSGTGQTLYARFGDWFAWTCFLAVIAALLL